MTRLVRTQARFFLEPLRTLDCERVARKSGKLGRVDERYEIVELVVEREKGITASFALSNSVRSGRV